MKDEAMAGSHEKDGAGKHLWVIGFIAASAAVVVTATWTGIGNVAGFAPLPLYHLKVPTGITLATGTEGYTGYALWAWLGGACGERSRKFAGATAIGALALSLSVQAPYHLMLAEHWRHPPVLLVIGASSVPVVDVILGSVLGHLQLADKAAARKAAAAAAEAERRAEAARREASRVTALERELADERSGYQQAVSDLRAEFARELEAMGAQHSAGMGDLQERLGEAVSAQEDAQAKLAEAVRRSETLERQLARAKGEKPQPKATAKAGDDVTEGDLTTELRALMELRANPGLRKQRMGGELARRLGISASHGRRFHGQFTSDGELSEAAEALIASLPERPV